MNTPKTLVNISQILTFIFYFMMNDCQTLMN